MLAKVSSFCISAFLAILTIAFSSLPANAIENGDVAFNGPVVGLTYGASPQVFCSGAMVEPRILITANHCLPAAGLDPFFLNKNKITVSFPGTKIGDPAYERANAVHIFTSVKEWTIGDCEKGYCEDLRDVAVIVIDKDFPVQSDLKVATEDDLIRFRANRAKVITYGYGYTGKPVDKLVTPRKMEAELTEPNLGGYGKFAFNVEVFGNQNTCSGDSGGPSYVQDGGTLFYIGPTSGSRRPSCIELPEKSSGFYGGTPLIYKIDLLKLAQDSVIADKLKAESELKAKEEAAKKAIAAKKTTITCIKGKLIKKVTAIKPVCPKGYKKK